MDSLTMAISQGSLRRGSAACYLPVDHPEIEEFIEMRRPTGGDPNRKALNLTPWCFTFRCIYESC
jgi:ribonucleoside-diphosphate reductase alpha chain